MGSHSQHRRPHMLGQLSPKLLAGREADPVFASLRDECEDVGSDQILQFIRVYGKQLAILLRGSCTRHHIQLEFGKEETAEHARVFVPEFALGEVHYNPKSLPEGVAKRKCALFLAYDLSNLGIRQKGRYTGEERLANDDLHPLTK